MNRTISAVIMVFVIVLVIYANTFLLEKKVFEIVQLCQKFENSVITEDFVMAKAQFSSIKSTWAKDEKLIVMLVGRSHADPIYSSLDVIDVYIKQNNISDSLPELRQVISELRSIIITEKLSVENFG